MKKSLIMLIIVLSLISCVGTGTNKLSSPFVSIEEMDFGDVVDKTTYINANGEMVELTNSMSVSEMIAIFDDVLMATSFQLNMKFQIEGHDEYEFDTLYISNSFRNVAQVHDEIFQKTLSSNLTKGTKFKFTEYYLRDVTYSQDKEETVVSKAYDQALSSEGVEAATKFDYINSERIYVGLENGKKVIDMDEHIGKHKGLGLVTNDFVPTNTVACKFSGFEEHYQEKITLYANYLVLEIENPFGNSNLSIGKDTDFLANMSINRGCHFKQLLAFNLQTKTIEYISAEGNVVTTNIYAGIPVTFKYVFRETKQKISDFKTELDAMMAYNNEHCQTPIA